jgi:hypothetical protein
MIGFFKKYTIASRYTFFIPPVIIFSLVVSSFAFIPTKKADAALDGGAVMSAAIGVGLNCLLAGLVPSPGSLTQVPVNDITQNNKTCSLDTIATAMAKVLLSSITDSMVDWAQNGFPNGGPSFAKNLNRTMQNVADGEIANFFTSLTGVNICDPANVSFLLSLNKIQTPQNQYACTLTMARANFEAFKQNFESGGWMAYNEALGEQNNPIGFAIKASADVTTKTNNKQNLLMQELGWGNGFFNYKDANGNTLTPNAAIKTQLDNSLNSSTLQLQFADSINEVFVAVMNALAQKAFNDARGFFN